MQKPCFLGPIIFEIPQPNWYYVYIPEPLINLNENCKLWVGLLLFKASEAYMKGEFGRPLARVLLKYNGFSVVWKWN